MHSVHHLQSGMVGNPGHHQDELHKYNLSTKILDANQANMSLNLVKGEALAPHYGFGGMDHHGVSPV